MSAVARLHAIRVMQADRAVVYFPPLAEEGGKFLSIQWSEELAIDHGVIDQDHQTLIAILNAFLDAGPSDAPFWRSQAALDKLHQHALAHFSREEALQAQVHFPDLDAHHQEHLELSRKLANYREQLARFTGPRDDPVDGSPIHRPSAICEPNEQPGDIAALCDNVGVFIRDWLIDHVVRSDLRMKPYVAEMAQYARHLSPLDQAVTERADGLRIEEQSARSSAGSQRG